MLTYGINGYIDDNFEDLKTGDFVISFRSFSFLLKLVLHLKMKMVVCRTDARIEATNTVTKTQPPSL